MSEVKHITGDAGGYLVGRRHSNGGIKAINKSTGQPLEMEGGEVVITRDAVSDETKRSFNGKMMTNREILSEINQSGGGVAFAEGGEVPESIDYIDMDLEYDGEKLDSKGVLAKMAVGGEIDNLLQGIDADWVTYKNPTESFEEGGDTNQDELQEYRGYQFSIYIQYLDRKKEELAKSIVKGLLDLPQTLGYLIYHEKMLKGDAFEIIVDARILKVPQGVPASLSDAYEEYNIKYTTSIAILENLFYSQLVEEIASRMDVNQELSVNFKKACKIYFLGFEGRVSYTTKEQDNPTPQYLRFSSVEAYENQKYFDELNEGFPFISKDNNYKDFEKVGKTLISQKATNFGLKGKLYLKSFGFEQINRRYGFTTYFKNMLDLKPKSKTNWDWWQQNIFSKQAFGVYEESRYITPAFNLILDEIDYSAYKSDLSIVVVSRRTDQTRDKIKSKLENLSNESKIELFSSFKLFTINKGFETEATDHYNKSVLFTIKWQTSNFGTTAIGTRINQTEYFFAGDEGVFYFSDDTSLFIDFDLKSKALKQKEELEAKLKAEAAKKEEKEALKNRPYKVRDQREDFEQIFIDSSQSKKSVDEIVKNQKELEASLKLLSLIKGLPLTPLKRKLLVKIRQLTEEATGFDSFLGSEESGVYSEEKLVSPLGLMTYYYTQARQSPVAKMGEPCGYPTPSGEPSELDIQAYFAVRTRYFKKWFGDWEQAYESKDYTNCSTLINPITGEPRIMYHGVRKFIQGLQTGAMGSGVVRPYGEFRAPKFPATYFGDSLNYVEFYAGEAKGMPKPSEDYEGFIYSVFINMRNPIRLEGLGMEATYKDILAYIAIKYGLVLEPTKALSEKYSGNKLKVWNFIRTDINLITTLKKFGYDGIVQYGDVPEFTNGLQTGNKVALEYLVFSPNQVKSAVVKNSFYTRFFNDIRFKKGGYVRL
jgi:hypothetical protein